MNKYAFMFMAYHFEGRRVNPKSFWALAEFKVKTCGGSGEGRILNDCESKSFSTSATAIVVEDNIHSPPSILEVKIFFIIRATSLI